MADVPTTFGKYYLTEKLAVGGMAEIYLAKLIGPSGFEKLLVIKQIMPQWSGDAQFVDLFVNEAKTLVALTHGNIVPIYELGVVDHIYFIAMEYIDGITIEELLSTLHERSALMPPVIAAWIAARVLDGLDYAHRKGQGVLHRDISPRNIMLSRDGEVKLLDFGIALPLDTAAEGSVALAGSYPYMSPEQASGQALTSQSDIFSVGVVLWELLTGQILFRRDDMQATLQAVMHDAIAAPATLRDDVPPAIDAAVMRALDRSLTTRWPSAGELAAELSRVIYQQPTPPNARDVALLVAHYAPSHGAVPRGASAQPTDSTQLEPTGNATLPSPPQVPHTTPLPSRSARLAAARQQSFATAVGFDALLTPARAQGPTTTKVIEAPAEGPSTAPVQAGTPTGLASTAAMSPAVLASASTATPSLTPASDLASLAPPLRDATPTPTAATSASKARSILAALALAAAITGGIVVWRSTRAIAPLTPTRDAAQALLPLDSLRPDAQLAIDAAAVSPVDAAPRDATPRDAARVLVAPRDGRGVPRPTIDAAPPIAPLHDAPTAQREQATLRVGAIPWGEVYIDGTAVGRTPLERQVPAGEHQIEIRFPVGSPPRSETYRVLLVGGETKRLLADFAAAAGSANPP